MGQSIFLANIHTVALVVLDYLIKDADLREASKALVTWIRTVRHRCLLVQ